MGFLYQKFLRQPETPLEDILRNIGYLLRAKRGASSFLRHFGLTETGFRTSEEMLNTLSQEIKESLALHEPRVEVTEIEEDYPDDDPRPRLLVHCRLKESQRKLSLVLDPKSREVKLAGPAQG
jgi:predicted component of type VI protein secretion system